MTQKNNNKQNFKNTQRFYDCLFENDDHYGAKEYRHGWAGNFRRYRIKVLKNIFVNTLKCQKETKVLDIGSNISSIGQIFQPEDCPQVTAFDISTIIVQKAKKIYPYIK